MLTRERVFDASPEREVARPRGSAHFYRQLAVKVAVTDTALLGAAGTIGWAVTQLLRPLEPVSKYHPLFVPLACLPVFALLRLYSLSSLSPAEEFRRVPVGVGLGMSLVVLTAFWLGRPISRIWVGVTWVLALVLVMATRRGWHWWMGKARARGILQVKTLIVGTNDEGRRLAHNIRGKLGFRTVGFVSTGENYVRLDGLPVWSFEDIQGAIRASGADSLFIAASAVSPGHIREASRAARRQDVALRISANVTQILSSRVMIQPIGQSLALSLRQVRLSGPQAALKRTFDVAVAGAVTLFTAPVWIAAAALVVLTSRGGVFYRQERIGREGRPFMIYKFRTMVAGADQMLESLRDSNEASGPLFKVRDDPRITRVGRALRRWSLDELPQLLNVLRGEMSLVGPRPPLPREVDTYAEWHFDRLAVRPGMSGLWQVSGRSDLPFDEAVNLDLFYVENWSIGYDLFILLKTLPAVLARKGAY